MRFRVGYYRDEWVLFDAQTREVLRLDPKVPRVLERARTLAEVLSLAPEVKLQSKWWPL